MSLALEPQRLTGPPADPNRPPEPIPGGLILAPALGRFWRLFRLSLWRAFEHDAFATAKGGAYSSILTFFPFLLVLGSVMATVRRGEVYLREISDALGRILPAGSAAALAYSARQLESARWPAYIYLSTYDVDRFGRNHLVDGRISSRLPAPEDLGTVARTRDRHVTGLMAGLPLDFSTILVALGSRVETRVLFSMGHEFGPVIVLLGGAIRWLIAILTSIAVMQLIYHNAVPRTQPWHSVLPGAVLATAMWLLCTAFFGWYLQHYVDYSVIYGSLGVGIALLTWMYVISLVVLIGAEFNAMLYPRGLGKPVRRASDENR